VNPAQAEYVIPDVFVRRTDHGWVVEINQATVPRVRVNQSYANLISRAPDHAMLRTQLQEARWLMRSLEIRNETLIKVARCIVQRQTGFFDQGEEAMVPLILKDVAEAVEMHESTISRVTTAKYMHTPRGVFEFRYFFSSHVEAADGTEMSSTAIRAKIKKLISQENSEIPGATASSRRFCPGRASGREAARWPNTAKACRSPHPTNASARLPARPNLSLIRRFQDVGGLMQLDLSGHHVEVTPPCAAMSSRRFERISRHFEQLIDVHCVLTVEKLRHKAEATLMLRGTKIYADATTETCMPPSMRSPTSSTAASRSTRRRPRTHHAEEVIKARSSS